MEHFLQYIVSLLGILISGVVAFIVSRQQSKIKLKEIFSKFSEQLYLERLRAYPKLYEITGGLSTLLPMDNQKNTLGKAELQIFLSKLIEWDEKNAILAGPEVMEKLFLFRRILTVMVSESNKYSFIHLTQAIGELEFEIKREIGSFTAESFKSYKKKIIEDVQEYEERFNNYKLKY